MSDKIKSHWENVYKTKEADAVSWYQPTSNKSIKLIEMSHPNRDAKIIDIGSGASILIDQLLKSGYENISALDISEDGLRNTKARVDEKTINWIVSDILEWCPTENYDIWHDRAVFHFQTDLEAREKYISCLKKCLRVGGCAIIATFALDGPEKCSGLPVRRYSPETLEVELSPSFRLVASELENHQTPWGSSQKFQYSRFIRV